MGAFLTPFFTVIGADCSDASKIFSSNYGLTITFDGQGDAKVNQKVSLTNLVDGCFASEYSLNINSTNVRSVSGRDSLGNLSTQLKKKKESTTVTVKLNDEVIGKNKTVAFELSYVLKGLAKKQGLLWNLAVPQITTSEVVKSYNLVIVVPFSFGGVFSISPTPKSIKATKNRTVITYDKSTAFSKSISASLGSHQEISFTLKHQLENKSFLSKNFLLYLPPDTRKQQVLYKTINPSPKKLTMDKYGNYIAEYRVGGRSTVEVVFEGVVKVIAEGKDLPSPVFLSSDDLDKLKDSGRFIQVQDRLIQEKAKELKSTQAIYDFVVGYLEYDSNSYEAGSAGRLGAVELLRNNTPATNLDFVGLFLALTKASGIPSRIAFGLVIQDKDGFKPTFVGNPLNSRDLHVWAQIYDFKKKIWVDVDPTWGRTLSSNHIQEVFGDRFVLLTSNSGDDLDSLKALTISSNNIVVSGAEKKSDFTPKIDLLLESDQAFAGFPVEIKIKIQNNSGVSLTSGKIVVSTENVDLITDNPIEIPIIFPFETKVYKIKLRTGGIFGATLGNINVQFISNSGVDKIKLSKQRSVVVKSFFSIGPQQVLLFILVILLVIGAFSTKITRFFRR
ncbi:transglutaminase domain-containing protein [Patescibacteria group bacterium]|nr:transglutaminase domain-containing protein [Patescibacteria group bacterium]